jgi:hypothetical protein
MKDKEILEAEIEDIIEFNPYDVATKKVMVIILSKINKAREDALEEVANNLFKAIAKSKKEQGE